MTLEKAEKERKGKFPKINQLYPHIELEDLYDDGEGWPEGDSEEEEPISDGNENNSIQPMPESISPKLAEEQKKVEKEVQEQKEPKEETKEEIKEVEEEVKEETKVNDSMELEDENDQGKGAGLIGF